MLDVEIEAERLEIQRRVDSLKNPKERNKLGQFATSASLAKEIVEFVRAFTPEDSYISFLDPAIGTGSFYSALLYTFDQFRIRKATGYEVDALYANEAAELWKNEDIELHLADFTYAVPPDHDDKKWNLLICNPPYVRHHHLSPTEKLRLQFLARQATGIELSKLAGLYGYFLLISHSWMMDDGLAVWLIPGEFMDVNYGKAIREYLLTKVSLLRVHRFAPEDVQFDDALVSSTIVCFKKNFPAPDRKIDFTYGGTLLKPLISRKVSSHVLMKTNKWNKIFIEKDDLDKTSVSATMVSSDCNVSKENFSVINNEKKSRYLRDFFDIKRGLATGANDYFILTEQQISQYHIPKEFVLPVLPNSRYIKEDMILADEDGYPRLESRQFLFTSSLPEIVIKSDYPFVWKYLQLGIEKGINQGYLCRSRKLWYQQEKRPDCKFLFAYMGRGDVEKESPFRFLLNYSNATVTNAYYILYPRPFLKSLLDSRSDLNLLVFKALQEISANDLVGEGRTYGGGLHKLEPKELADVPFSDFWFALKQCSEETGNEDKEVVNLRLWD